MQQPAPTAADHAAHDRMAVAAYAAGDATGPGLTTATALVVTCPECASLHRDLRAIAAALPATAAPLRPRDFRITPGQAATLRPAGWRRILAPFAGPGFAFAGPLGSGLATLGLAGILVAGAAGLPLGGASSASAPVAGGGASSASAPVAGGGEVQATAESPAAADKVTAATIVPAELAPVPAASGIENGYVMGSDETTAGNASSVGPGSQAGTGAGAGTGQPMGAAMSAGPEAQIAGPAPERDAAARTPVPVVAVVSGLALLAGLVLLALRLAGRRLQQTP